MNVWFVFFAIASMVTVVLIANQICLYRKCSEVESKSERLSRECKRLEAEKESLEHTLSDCREEMERLKQLTVKSEDAATRQIQQLRSSVEDLRADMASVSDMTDAELMVWIDRRMDEERLYQNPHLSLKMLSKALGVTQKRIAQVLRTQTNYGSLNAYLTEKRLLRACELLREKQNWVVEAVSAEAGFSSRRTFQDIFKSRLGITPSQYRQQYEGEGKTCKNIIPLCLV